MSMATNPRGRHRTATNVAINDLSRLVRAVEDSTNQQPVVIGGRAVNIWTSGQVRLSPDIDLAFARRPSSQEFRGIAREADKDGVSIVVDGDPDARTRPSILYYSPTLVGMGRLKADIYYPGYVSPVNGMRPSSEISGIPIWHITSTAETVQMGDTTFKVVNKPTLIIMKFITWQNRENPAKKEQDMADMHNVIRNHYATTVYDLDKLLKGMGKILQDHMPSRKNEILKGILGSVDFEEINPRLLKFVNEKLAILSRN